MHKKLMRKGFLVLGSCVLLAMTVGFTSVPRRTPVAISTSIQTNLARYNPGELVTFHVSVTNSDTETLTGQIHVSIDHLNTQIAVLHNLDISVPGKASRVYTITWNPPKEDFQGYLVHGAVTSQTGAVVGTFTTAVDVSSSWTKFPRYGFVSTYPQMTLLSVQNELKQLKNYHIDGLQFYDWQWEHHVPLAGTVAHPASSWQDIAGRTNYRQTILDMIQVGHQLGMASFNYNLLYGAWAGYQTDGSGVKPAWGLYYDNGGNIQVSVSMPSGWSTTAIDLFNPANPSWRQYILKQEANVFKAYPFDGWQMDQLGDQGIVFDAKGNPINLANTFAPFINNAATTLHKQVIFNNVGGYGLDNVVANSKESVAYIECWPNSGQATYNDLKSTIDTVISQSKGKKSAVLAAYLDSTYANSFSDQKPGYFDTPGVLLADATIFASGGDHIELGDNLQMLNAPYFPNHNLVMDSALKMRLLSYYNFMVAYENLLRGGLRNTTNSVVLQGIKTSPDSSPNTVWEFTKSGNGYDVIQFINLYRQYYNLWQDSSASMVTPPTLRNVRVRYFVGPGKIQGIFEASPDVHDGATIKLPYVYTELQGKQYISFTIPSLQYWDMVYVKR